MVDTKPTEVAVKKWTDAIGRIPANYKDGVQATTGFVEKAVAAEDLWVERITAAAAAKKREKGLRAISDEDWKRAAAEKGARRIGPGMRAAEGKFREGIAKVLDTIRGVSIPPRTADWSANIDNRLKPIVEALKKLKE